MTGNSIKILLIEDSPWDIKLFKELLKEVKNIKFNLKSADRLEIGLKKLKKEKFDVILVDLGLPDSNGMDTLNELLNQNMKVPIIVLTGLDDEAIGIKAVQSGAQDYLLKGEVDGNCLARSMRYAIERKKMEEDLKKYTEQLEEKVKQRTNELIQAEKMASLGQLVAGVAHEVNNPLAYITLNTNIIEERIVELKEYYDKEQALAILNEINNLLEIITKGVDRIATITRALKRFAIPNASEINKADLNQGIRDTLMILYNQFKDRINIHESYGKIPRINCNIGQLNQVFMNVLMNSSQAMEQGDIWIKTLAIKNNINIEIKDNGSGIPDEIISKVFDPFFTTKEDGTGLGLSLVYRIIEDHKGEIKVFSKEGKGTRILISLPKEV